MRAIALVPLLIALTPRGPHGPIGDRVSSVPTVAGRAPHSQGPVPPAGQAGGDSAEPSSYRRMCSTCVRMPCFPRPASTFAPRAH